MPQTINPQYDSQKFELAAINILLQTINEPPIEDEEHVQNVLEAQMAKTTINEVKMSVLSEEWDFNTDNDYVLAPDTSGHIPVPANILDLTGNRKDVIMRDWRLYSKTEQTSIFTEEVSCKIVWNMEFNSLTHPLRYYITVRAARVFQGRTIGDTNAYSFSKEDEHQAYLAARRSEGRTAADNILDSAFGQNSQVWN